MLRMLPVVVGAGRPVTGDPGPSSTASAGELALPAVTRRYLRLRLETRVVTRTDTSGNLTLGVATATAEAHVNMELKSETVSLHQSVETA